MRYPVVNLGAVGGRGIPAMSPFAPAWIQQRAPAQQPGPYGRVLGQTAPPPPELVAARKEYQDAKDVYDRVERTYPKLAAAIGEDGAREAWSQAKDKMDRSAAKLEDLIAGIQEVSA
jgi:hypothetical protein